MEKQLRILKYYVVICTTLLGIVALAAFRRSGERLNVDEITAKRISLIDSAGHVRITIEGSLPGRLSALSGLPFHDTNGTEAGGLVYRGRLPMSPSVRSSRQFQRLRGHQITVQGTVFQPGTLH